MKIEHILIAFIFAVSFAGRASAVETDYDAGTDALPLQYAGGTARATAMGSAVVAVPQGAASVLSNPAGLSRLECMEVGAHHYTGLGDTSQETAVFGMPLGPVKDGCKGGTLGAIAASLHYVDYGSFSGRDSSGLLTGSYHARDYTGSVGWGAELANRLSAGIALKASQSEYSSKSYYSYTADLGLLYAVTKSLDLGFTYSNIKVGSNIGDLVAGWKMGAAWTVDKHLLLAFATELQNSSMDRLQFGAEYLVGNVEGKKNVLALRAGYQVNYPDPQLSGLTGLTMGLGYTLTRSFTIDYALVPAGDLGTTHRFSLTYKFDCPDKKKPVAEALPEQKPEPLAAVVPVTAVQPEPEAAVVKSIFLEDSHFDYDKSALRPEGMAALHDNIQILKDNPKSLVRVAGYTSMKGTEEYNQGLSERRAEAVKAFLVAEGIKPARITTIGYGEKKPANYEAIPGDIDTAAAKSNMRVLFTVTVK